jgi:hypothetical protein
LVPFAIRLSFVELLTASRARQLILTAVERRDLSLAAGPVMDSRSEQVIS